MKTSQNADPIEVCEDILRATKNSNIENKIRSSETLVIDRLLARRIELQNTYDEIHRKLCNVHFGIYTALGVVLSVAAHWNPEKISESYKMRKQLIETNSKIKELSFALAALLRNRDQLNNLSRFSSNTTYHIVDLIDTAADGNGYYVFHLKDELETLSHQYDLKYWPRIEDIVEAIGWDADHAIIEPSDPLTGAATNSLRTSLADFFRALFASLEENSSKNHGPLPDGFKLSDNSLASLANCALGLGPNEGVDGAYVKGIRHRDRHHLKHSGRLFE